MSKIKKAAAIVAASVLCMSMKLLILFGQQRVQIKTEIR